MLFRLRIHTTVLVKKIDHDTKINEIERKFLYYDHVNIKTSKSSKQKMMLLIL